MIRASAVCWLLLCGGLAWAGAPHELLYEEALTAAADDPARARALLLEVVRLEPRHAGAWLDLALLACAAGDAGAARGLLRRVADDFSPPPAVRALIEAHLAHPCLPGPVDPATLWRLGGTLGFDSNVNSGTHTRYLALDTGSGAISLPLAPELQPRGDHFNELWTEVSRPITLGTGGAGRPVLLRLGAMARQYAREKDFDLRGASLSAELPAGAAGWGGRAQLGYMVSWLGNAPYMDALAAGWTGDLPLSPRGCRMHHEWSVASVRFAENPLFNVLTLHARVGVSGQAAMPKPAADGQWRVNAVLSAEAGRAMRPGGDRLGGGLEFFAGTRLSPRVRLGVQGRVLQMTSESGYLPPLLPERRRQLLLAGRAEVSVRLGDGWEWVSSWQMLNSRDNLSFLSYRAHTLQSGVVLAF